MALFNADSYQEVSIDWLTVTLKYHGGVASNVAHPRIMDEVRAGLLRTIEHKLDLTRQMKSREKHE